MNIVLALHQYPPYGDGGTEQLASWTARELRNEGHDVRIVSAIPRRLRDEKRPPDRRNDDGVEIEFLAHTNPISQTDKIRTEYDDPDAGLAFGRALDRRPVDLVHFFHLGGLTTAALNAAVARRIPVVLLATDFWFECMTIQLLLADGSMCEGPSATGLNCARHLAELRHPALRGLEHAAWLDGAIKSAFEFARRLPRPIANLARPYEALNGRNVSITAAMRLASRILAPTEGMRQRLLASGIPERIIQLVRYGVPEPSRSSIASRREAAATAALNVAFVGTLAPHKGVHILFDALRRAPDLNLTVKVYGVASDHAYLAMLRKLASGDLRIRFEGTVENRKIGDLFAAIDVLVLPSQWRENAPLVALQAIAHRCPILAADVPGLRECVRDGRDGWFFVRADPGDLAAKLRWIAEDKGRIAGIRGQPFTPRTVREFAADLLDVYDQVIACRGVPA